jgi:hypothetical protein
LGRVDDDETLDKRALNIQSEKVRDKIFEKYYSSGEEGVVP